MVEEVSIVKLNREQYYPVLETSSVDDLLAMMRKKNAELSVNSEMKNSELQLPSGSNAIPDLEKNVKQE